MFKFKAQALVETMSQKNIALRLIILFYHLIVYVAYTSSISQHDCSECNPLKLLIFKGHT